MMAITCQHFNMSVSLIHSFTAPSVQLEERVVQLEKDVTEVTTFALAMSKMPFGTSNRTAGDRTT